MDHAVVAQDIKRSDLLDMYFYLRLTRSLEDRITALYRQGRIVGAPRLADAVVIAGVANVDADR